MTSSENVQATFVATLVDEWIRHGVLDAVVCPGSRSTPLALALAARPEMHLHVHHDERAAGFMALGLGMRGWPALVVTTSGTAAVNLHPAVVEASMGGVPMIVCTADRPAELRDVGAPQTIDQTHLYGRAARWFADAGIADEGNRHAWRSLATRAVLEASGARPGPVHVNLPFREPLVGEAQTLPPVVADERMSWFWRGREPHVEDPDGMRVRRGLFVLGGGLGDSREVMKLVEATRWPALADARSGCRGLSPNVVGSFDALLRHEPFASGQRPEVVVRLGSPPASRVLSTWLAGSDARQIAIAREGDVFDSDHTAAYVVRAAPDEWCAAMASSFENVGDANWVASWMEAERVAQSAFDEVLSRHAEATEPGVARALLAGLPPDAKLVVGSSMPVRDLEWYGRPREGVQVLSNRGANGIDGVVSTAVGVASHWRSGSPVVVLVGDVSFLHDSNALLGLRDRDLNLTIVVVDNRGGGIFSFLPQATAVPRDRFELLFGTPHDVDIAELAAVHGIPALTVDTAASFATALAAAIDAPGTNVVVVRTERVANVAVHDELHAAVAAALA